ncbi:hypothetical protein V6N13_125354 [Hibiscus sabdariffa]
MLNKTILDDGMQSIRLAIGALVLTHLHFTDDCLIFEAATANEAYKNKEILDNYDVCPGQLANYDKFGAFFSPNVSDHIKEVVFRILNVQSITNLEKYMGLPAIMGRNNKRPFVGIELIVETLARYLLE